MGVILDQVARDRRRSDRASAGSNGHKVDYRTSILRYNLSSFARP